MKYCPKCRTRYPEADGLCPRDQSPLEPDPLLGWTVARRRLDGVLGEGAQAVVYRATHVDLHRAEVVKILKQRSGNLSPERFAREARALASMSTEHVVQVHDYGQTADGEHFLVMELVSGDSLREVLQREGPLELARALRIVEQLCLGLAEAHRLGIIHRDLKPDNVLLERRKGATERVKIVDF
ncbi:MAG: serine/threonine protein kinase, partial [Myxococcales bacterium]|nr:serine/threonine protein kinase [Myxococcales bacterium]